MAEDNRFERNASAAPADQDATPTTEELASVRQLLGEGGSLQDQYDALFETQRANGVDVGDYLENEMPGSTDVLRRAGVTLSPNIPHPYEDASNPEDGADEPGH